MNAVETLTRLRRKGLAKMGPTGQWEPSDKGDELLAELELLGELAAARDQRSAGGMMSQRTRAGRRPEQRTGGGGWQKPVVWPTPESRPKGLPPVRRN